MRNRTTQPTMTNKDTPSGREDILADRHTEHYVTFDDGTFSQTPYGWLLARLPESHNKESWQELAGLSVKVTEESTNRPTQKSQRIYQHTNTKRRNIVMPAPVGWAPATAGNPRNSTCPLISFALQTLYWHLMARCMLFVCQY